MLVLWRPATIAARSAAVALLAASIAACGRSAAQPNPYIGGAVYLDFSGALGHKTGAVGHGNGWRVTPGGCPNNQSDDQLDNYTITDFPRRQSTDVAFTCDVTFSNSAYGKVPFVYALVVKRDGSWTAKLETSKSLAARQGACSREACQKTPGVSLPPPAQLSGKARGPFSGTPDGD